MKVARSLLMALTPLCLSTLVFAEDIRKIPRENGAVHKEFRILIDDYVKKFKTGIGRIALEGGDDCKVDFYTNKETTFVTINIDEGDFYNEFYIDHPTQSFRKILFQNLITHDNGQELKVVKRDEGYSIIREGQSVTLACIINKQECRFEIEALSITARCTTANI